MSNATSAERWFKRVLWIGIVANLALSIPTLVTPERAMRSGGLPLASPLVWPQFAGLLLILLSIFYMPAAVNPNRYRIVAWLAVFARLAGVIFFLFFQAAEYHMLGYFDLVFFVPELILLIRMPAAIAVAATTPSSAMRPTPR